MRQLRRLPTRPNRGCARSRAAAGIGSGRRTFGCGERTARRSASTPGSAPSASARWWPTRPPSGSSRATPPEIAALIGCAVTTGFGAVVNTAGVRAGESVVVIGAGGVGLSAVMGARFADAGPSWSSTRTPRSSSWRDAPAPRMHPAIRGGRHSRPDRWRSRSRPRGHRPHRDGRAGDRARPAGRDRDAGRHDAAGRRAGFDV